MAPAKAEEKTRWINACLQAQILKDIRLIRSGSSNNVNGSRWAHGELLARVHPVVCAASCILEVLLCVTVHSPSLATPSLESTLLPTCCLLYSVVPAFNSVQQSGPTLSSLAS